MAAASGAGQTSWTCEACTMGNVGSRMLCDMCGTPKPGAKLSEVKAGDESKAGMFGGIMPGDDLQEANERAIAAVAEDVARRNPLVSHRERGFDSMIAEFDRNEPFKAKVNEIAKNYTGLRRVRGDGSCFYRAYMFAICERMLGNKAEIDRLVKVFETCLARMTALGFPTLATEDPCDMICDFLRSLGEPSATLGDVEATFNDDGRQQYIVMFVRMIVSLHIQTNADDFTPYLGGKTVKEFVSSDVEPMTVDCEMPQIIALGNELGVPLRVEYLDSSSSALTGHTFPPEGMPQVFLVFRPGHYDILYPAREPPAPTGRPHWTPGHASGPPASLGAAAAVRSSGTDEKKGGEEKKEGKDRSGTAGATDDLAGMFGI